MYRIEFDSILLKQRFFTSYRETTCCALSMCFFRLEKCRSRYHIIEVFKYSLHSMALPPLCSGTWIIELLIVGKLCLRPPFFSGATASVCYGISHGFMTWSPNKPDYDRLRWVHHSMLLRYLGWRQRKRDDHILSYADALAKTASESIEAIIMRKRRILFAGFVARMGEERLPQRVMFGELVGGKGYSGGQEND